MVKRVFFQSKFSFHMIFKIMILFESPWTKLFFFLKTWNFMRIQINFQPKIFKIIKFTNFFVKQLTFCYFFTFRTSSNKFYIKKKIGVHSRNFEFCLRVFFKFTLELVQQRFKVGWGLLDPKWEMCEFSEVWVVRVTMVNLSNAL